MSLGTILLNTRASPDSPVSGIATTIQVIAHHRMLAKLYVQALLVDKFLAD